MLQFDRIYSLDFLGYYMLLPQLPKNNVLPSCFAWHFQLLGNFLGFDVGFFGSLILPVVIPRSERSEIWIPRRNCGHHLTWDTDCIEKCMHNMKHWSLSPWNIIPHWNSYFFIATSRQASPATQHVGVTSCQNFRSSQFGPTAITSLHDGIPSGYD